MDSPAGQNPPHILILDDDTAHQELCLRAFRDDPGRFRISVAGTLHEARQVIGQDPPDLIIADWILPGGKGLDILPRSDGKVTIPVIVMTSYGDEHLAVEIMKSGAIDYVVKSATVFRELPRIANRALRDWENIQDRKRAEAKAQDAQKRLADVLNFLPDAVLAIDNTGTVIGWNHAIERMTGVPAVEMLGKGDHEYSLPFYGMRRPILIDLVLMDDAEIEKKYDYIRRDNGRITSETFIPGLFGGKGAYLWGTASPLADAAGNRTGAIEVIRDITERKRIALALEKSEDRFRHISGLTSDFAYSCTHPRDGCLSIDWITGACQKITGYPEEEILKMGCWRGIVAEEDLPVFDEQIGDLRPGSASECELRIRTRDGAEKWLRCFAECISDPDDPRTIRLFGGCKDITGQKNADEALVESEKKYRFLIDNVRDVVWQTKPDLTFTYVSPSVESRTGYSPAELVGTSLLSLLTESSARVVRERLRERMADYSRGSRDLATVFEIEITRKDGGTCWFEVSSNALSGPDKSIANFQGISRDITERKRVESALMESEARFRDLFNTMGAGVAIYEPTPDGDDFIIRNVNRAVETIEKVKKEEIVGRSVREVFPSVEEFGLFGVFQRVARTGIPESHPVSMYKDDRISGWRENYVYRLPSGEIVALYEDVTEKKQAEDDRKRLLAAVEVEREKLSSLVSSITDEVWFADTERRFTLANPRAMEVFGLDPGVPVPVETLAESLTVLRPDGTLRPVEEAPPLRALNGEVVRNLEEMVKTPLHGELRYRLVSAAPVRNSSGIILGSVSVVRDITEMKRAEEALKVSQAQLKEAMDLARLVNWEFDALSGIFTFNDRFYSLYGTTAEQEGGYRMPAEEYARRFIPSEDQGLVADEVRKAVEATDPAFISQAEHRIVRRDGEIRTIVVRFGIILDENGRTVKTFGANQDITDRKRMEQALVESEGKLRRITGNAPDMIFRMSLPDGVYEYVSPASVALTGYTPEEFYQEPGLIRRLIHPAWKTYLEEQWQALLQENAPPVFEFQIIDRAGNTRWNNQRNIVIRNEAGTVVAIEGIVTDVTQRKEAELALLESEGRYRGLMDHLPDYVLVHREGILLYVNPSGAARMGYDPETLVGRPILPLIDPAYHGTIQKAIAQRREGEDLPSYEIKIVPKDGAIRTVLVNGVMIQYGGGPASLNVLTDITLLKEAEEARKAYEIRLDSAMEIGSLAWWEMDLPDGSVRFDDRKATMLGYSPDQFHHFTDFTALLHPGDREPAMQAMRDHLEGSEARYHADYRIRTAGGTYRWFRDVGGITRRHPDGSPGTVTGIVIDITAAKEAEAAIRETETRFRALIQNSSDLIHILDADGRILYESPSAERILGYPEGSLLGTDPLDLVHPEDLERVRQDLGDVFGRTNPGVPTEFRMRKADGEYIWVDSIGTNLLDVDGVNGVVVTTRPIQQRKEAEQALQESEERLRLAMEGADVASWDWDLKTGTAVFSDRFFTMLDYRPGEFPTTYEGWIAHIHPDDKERVLPDLKRQIAEKRPLCEIEYRLLTKDGNWLWILGRGKIAEFDETGAPTRMTGVNIDITSRRLMESEIRSLNTVLEGRVKDRTEALSKANETLEEENAQRLEAEGKLQVAYDEKVMLLKEIHHRVKNNLQIIASLLNLQSRYIKDEPTLAVIRESQNRVKAMALVHEKLYKSDDISHISLADYLRFLGTGLFQFYDARSRGIQFHLEIGEVNVDINSAIPMGLIINELISNSLKYAFPDGRKGEISISVTKEEHTLTVLFRDTGIGIPADLDWQNTQSLGLRLVNTLVDQMDGTIELDRSAGTQFTMVVHEKV